MLAGAWKASQTPGAAHGGKTTFPGRARVNPRVACERERPFDCGAIRSSPKKAFSFDDFALQAGGVVAIKPIPTFARSERRRVSYG